MAIFRRKYIYIALVLFSFSFFISSVEFSMLNVFGSGIMSLRCFVSCLAVFVCGTVSPVDYGSSWFIWFV
jgi:uncharacterized membrane protein